MDKIFFALGVAVLGMLTVFVGLIILIAFITLLTKFTAAGDSKKKMNPNPAK